ncbi:DNA-binding protein [Psychrobacter sp. HII-4]|uniref:DNA-binding protein n=1 Tax=Psychrobacter sp. HII-4 TaxID=1569264 RepID=UPI00191AB88D|nr:DNA-binding protein [Psychrobacter sp. HII-4]
MDVNRSRPASYKLRMSEELHQWLKVNAAKNYRTLATEINMHLEQAMLKQQQEDNNAK